MAPSALAPTGTPSPSLLRELTAEVARHAPFAQMAPEHVAQFVAAATQVYHAPGELVLGPQSGTAGTLWLLRQGSILGAGGASSGSTEPFEFVAGDMFPVGVVLAGRAVTSTYTAHGDSFSLALPTDEVQRLASAKQISTQLSAAPDEAALRHLARQIRQFARHLLGQGVHARQLTELISHLNDVLTEALLRLVAARCGMDLSRACWLAFGSEGRGEQTVATDQDNGLVFVPQDPQQVREPERAAWLAFAREVNEALDDCGYPLCKGGVMASNPACCLSPLEWTARFTQWVEGGTPDHLLQASIFFDLRPLCGNAALAAPLQSFLCTAPAHVPRFIKQMADNALRRGAPLNWRGALATTDVKGQALLDLKLQGTAIFVDAARLYALAHGLSALGTRARLETAAPLIGVAPAEGDAWVAGFEFLQMLRLQLQLGQRAAPADNPNAVDTLTLNDIERRMLKETMRMARSLQQRIQLDYGR